MLPISSWGAFSVTGGIFSGRGSVFFSAAAFIICWRDCISLASSCILSGISGSLVSIGRVWRGEGTFLCSSVTGVLLGDSVGVLVGIGFGGVTSFGIAETTAGASVGIVVIGWVIFSTVDTETFDTGVGGTTGGFGAGVGEYVFMVFVSEFLSSVFVRGGTNFVESFVAGGIVLYLRLIIK